MENLFLKSIGFALGVMVFSGCSPDAVESDQPSAGDYIAEMQKIKASVNNQALLNEKVLALQKRYGVDVLRNSLASGGNRPSVVKSKSCDSCPDLRPSDLMLKRAASEWEIFGVKATEAPIERPYFEQFSVAAGQSISVSVSATQSGVDPFMVIYEIVEGGMYDYKSQQKLSMIGWSDDYSGLNPGISTGTFSSAKEVVVLIFAFNIYSKGQANVSIQIGGTTYTRNNVYVRGTAIFYDNNTYVDKDGQLVDVYANGWSRYLPGTTAFAGADYWSGEYTWGSYRPWCTGDSYIWAFNMAESKGVANDDAVEGLCSGVINDATWSSFPESSHYPSVVLLGGYSDGGTMNFLQISGFSR